MSTDVTPKATFTLANVGTSLKKEDLKFAGTTKLKYKKDDLKLEFSISDKSLTKASELKDIGVIADYKINKSLTLNTGFDLDTKAYKGGATWEGTVKGKKLQVKAAYLSKTKGISGEATATIDKANKATVYFTNKEVSSAKYVYTKDSLTFEPTFNLKTQKPALSISKKQGDNTYKIAYCLKSENATLEWKYDAVKVTMNSKVNKSGVSGKPTLAIALEKTFDL